MTGLLLRRRLQELRHALLTGGRPGALLVFGALAASALSAMAAFAFEAYDAAVSTLASTAAAWRHSATLTGPLADAPPAYVLWRDYVYWSATIGSAAIAYAAHHALHRRRDWPLLSSLPIPARATFNATGIDLAFALLIVPLAGTALAIPLYWSRQWAAMGAALLVSWGVHAVSVCAAMCLLPLAGESATSGASEFKRYLAGNWAPPEFAPFFYAPAGVLGVTAFAGIAVQKGAEDIAFGFATGRGAAVMAALAGGCAVALIVGRRMHVRSHARAVPLVREVELQMVATGAEAQPDPYGLWILGLMPAMARPILLRDLRQMNRAARGRYAVAIAGAAAFLLYTLRTEAVAGWAVLAAAGLTAFVGAVALRLAEEDLDVPWLRRVLPSRAAGGVATRAVLGSFLALHFAVPAGAALVLRGLAFEGGAVILLAPLSVTLASTLARAAPIPMLARAYFWLAVAAATVGALWRIPAGAALLLGAASLASFGAALRRVR